MGEISFLLCTPRKQISIPINWQPDPMAISLQNQNNLEIAVPLATRNSPLNYSGESPVDLFP